MGFQVQHKIYHLKFADEEMAGLVASVRSTSMGNILRVAEMDEMDPTHLSKEDLSRLREIFDIFSKCLLAWNAEEDGVPVPTTTEGLLSQDPEFVMSVIKAWTRAMTVPDAPLAKPSNDGEQFPEASIPMESLPSSLVG